MLKDDVALCEMEELFILSHTKVLCNTQTQVNIPLEKQATHHSNFILYKKWIPQSGHRSNALIFLKFKMHTSLHEAHWNHFYVK